MANQTDIINRLRLEIETLLRGQPELADDETLRADMLEGATDIHDVLIELGHRLGFTKALAAGLESYIDEITARLGRYVQREEFLRGLIFRVMESAQLKKIELPEMTLSLRAGQPKVIGDVDPATLPDEFCRITRAVNKLAVRAAIEAGRDVPGFTLSNASPSLSMRVK